VAKKVRNRPVTINHLRLTVGSPGTQEYRRTREINRFLNAATSKSGDGPSPFTVVKQRPTPVAFLVEKKRIGADELRAATEIETAWKALSGALMFKPLNWEKTDRGQLRDWNERTSHIVQQYQEFANYWSMKAKRGDNSLQILIYAVIDQRGFSNIEDEIGVRHGTAQPIVIKLLRDYCIRANWIDGNLRKEWERETHIA
jgi:hypothetical protein